MANQFNKLKLLVKTNDQLKNEAGMITSFAQLR